MTESNLERELRDHYRALTPAPSHRLAGRVEAALNDASARRFGRWVPGFRRGRLLPLGGLVAAAAALTVAAVVLLPLWYGKPAAPGRTPTAAEVAAAYVGVAGWARGGAPWAVRNGILYISPDAGHSWREHALPTPGGLKPTSFYLFALDADHVWVVMPGRVSDDQSTTAEYQVYRSLDGGATWQPTTLPGTYPLSCLQVYFETATLGYTILTPCQTPQADGPSAVLRTEDGGATWAVTGSSTRLNDLVVAVGSDTLWSGASGDTTPGVRTLLQVSRDAGATWTVSALPGLGTTAGPDLFLPGFTLAQPVFLTESLGFVGVTVTSNGSAEIRYFRTDDGGRSWSFVASHDRPAVAAPVFLDETHWYQPVTGTPGLESTSDGGRTWEAVAGAGLPDGTALPAGTAIEVLWMDDGQHGAIAAYDAVGGGIALFVTSDGGRSWLPADFEAR